mgnify:CR=1 FL=1
MSDDLIRRSDVYKAVDDWLAGRVPNLNIKDIPSADRPQGEWIDAEIPLECGGTMPIQVCNLCKTFYPLAYTGGGHRFCPNCGAKMKGADDE